MVDLLDFSEQIKTFYLLRHGETEASLKANICGASDIPLTEKGLIEAELVADVLVDFNIDSMFSSSLVRCSQTADIVARTLKMPTYYKHSGLLEKKEGDWESKTYWQIRAEHPKLWEKWSKDPINTAPPGGGESVADFVARVGRAIEDIRKKANTGQRVLLVTHAGVIKAIIMHTLDIPVQNFYRIDIALGSISRVDWSDSFATLKYSGLKPSDYDVLVS